MACHGVNFVFLGLSAMKSMISIELAWFSNEYFQFVNKKL